jgi:hypothetical protein
MLTSVQEFIRPLALRHNIDQEGCNIRRHSGIQPSEPEALGREVAVAKSTQPQEALDAITMLAQQIARMAPDCAEHARKIVELASELVPNADWATVRDAIEAETAGSDISDSDVNLVTDAVLRAIRPGQK